MCVVCLFVALLGFLVCTLPKSWNIPIVAILYLFKEIYGGVANSRVSPLHRSEGCPCGVVEVKSGSPLCARGGCAYGQLRRGPDTEEPPSPPGQLREEEATS